MLEPWVLIPAPPPLMPSERVWMSSQQVPVVNKNEVGAKIGNQK